MKRFENDVLRLRTKKARAVASPGSNNTIQAVLAATDARKLA